MSGTLLQTPLYPLHAASGARFAPFCGYTMPLWFSRGAMGEHLHTRSQAGLFDVSHMGQLRITPRTGSLRDAALALERLIPSDLADLPLHRQRYGLILNAQGGICDDLMVANIGDSFFVVVNAGCKHAMAALFENVLGAQIVVERLQKRALLALQGPRAAEALSFLCPQSTEMTFMDAIETEICGVSCVVTRSGYTGEDGFEISVPEGHACDLARNLLAQEGVEPAGLAARDSLRLEAGLCLSGQDIDETTTPVEAALQWVVPRVRRSGGAREGGYRGAECVMAQMCEGAQRQRVGLIVNGRAPMRAETPLFADADGAQQIGVVTSGAFGPSVNAPVAMGYVDASLSAVGTTLFGLLRGKYLPVTVGALPFVPARFRRSERKIFA